MCGDCRSSPAGPGVAVIPHEIKLHMNNQCLFKILDDIY